MNAEQDPPFSGVKNQEMKQLSGWLLLNFLGSVLFVIIYTLGTGLRGQGVGTDTHRYYRFFENLSGSPFSTVLDTHGASDVGFYTIAWVLTNIFGVQAPFLFVGLLLSVSVTVLVNKWVPNNLVLLTLAVYSIFPFLLSLSINTIRHGAAIAILLFAFTALANGKIKKYLILGFLGSILHLAIAVPILVGLISMKLTFRTSIALLLGSIGLTLLHLDLPKLINSIPGSLLPDTIIERFGWYLSEEGIESGRYQTGLRWDFLAFSILPWFSYQSIQHISQPKRAIDQLYMHYFAIIIFATQTMNYPFSDRNLVAAWILMPILIIYPLSEGQIRRNMLSMHSIIKVSTWLVFASLTFVLRF